MSTRKLPQKGGAWNEFAQALVMALRDVRHDFRVTFCMALALAAVLAPLLVLFGLKFGIISTMREDLRNNPQVREIRPLGQGQHSLEMINALSARPDVAFAVPTTRFLAATMTLRATDDGEPLEVEVIPTAPGDPLVSRNGAELSGPLQVLLTQRSAEKLMISAGATVQATAGRRIDGRREAVRVELDVVGIVPAAAFERDAAFVPLDFLLALEDYREGFSVPLLQADGAERPETPRTFASFRLYAEDLDDVRVLRDLLASEGIDAQTRMSDIALIQRLDTGLTAIFLLVAGLGGGGYLVSLAVSLYSAMDRKGRQFGLLRLIGFRSGSIKLFPVVHAMMTAALGSGLAIGLYFGFQPIITTLFRARLGFAEVICRLEPLHLLIAVIATFAAAGLASIWAARRAASVPPAFGLRDT